MLDKQKVLERMREISRIKDMRASDFVGTAYILDEIQNEFNKLSYEIIHTKMFDAKQGEAI